MSKIKFLKTKRIKLNGVQYKPYLIGDLPSTFGFIYNAEKDQERNQRMVQL